MRTRARLAAVFTGLALASLTAPAAIADEGPNSLDGVETFGVPNLHDGMDTFGIANLVITELVNDPVNQILNES
ncbi:hypothetical protein [Streptomyces griseoluteus]|uniref:hypothetical protein n=1 Tax=Streptomyces griseoluteus TaxID=29306 RepID=UPI0036FC10BE